MLTAISPHHCGLSYLSRPDGGVLTVSLQGIDFEGVRQARLLSRNIILLPVTVHEHTAGVGDGAASKPQLAHHGSRYMNVQLDRPKESVAHHRAAAQPAQGIKQAKMI